MPREQDQFLEVLDRDAAERRWLDAVRPAVLPSESVSLRESFGRMLAEDVAAEIDVPPFDRSNVDGYALHANETFGIDEEHPARFRVNGEELPTGVVPTVPVAPATATAISTGGMLPRGADAVAMVEITRLNGSEIQVTKPVTPGAGVTFAGTDIARGEIVLRHGTRLTSRETSVLAAIGRASVEVIRRPRVAILSTGDEIAEPGTALRASCVYDSNATMLADAVRELGALPWTLGIVPDDDSEIERALDRALSADLVLLSGGTSKGGGDISYRALARRTPGILVHGVALKPGKPICLGAVGSTPVAILPGFPTSAIFTFHEFIAPLLRTFGGVQGSERDLRTARMARRVNSERGRKEYLLVNLIIGDRGVVAYPMGKGSGSVTAFAHADGFVAIPKDQEYLDDGESVLVTTLGQGTRPADLVVIGSHCIGLDVVLGEVISSGYSTKTIWVGSQSGLFAAGRGECDIAGVHLLDPVTNRYNTPFLPPDVRLLRGYGRMQGIVFREDDGRFSSRNEAEIRDRTRREPDCMMVNRNRGSGTRVLIDEWIADARPDGYAVEARSHNAVAASVAQGRADWGIAIEPVAKAYGLGFLPLRAESYDFAVPESRWERPAVVAFREALAGAEVRRRLQAIGFLLEDAP